MARTRTRRLRRAGGLTAVTTVVVFSAITLPAHAAPEGTVLGAGAPGSVSDSYVVTLKGERRLRRPPERASPRSTGRKYATPTARP